jgi:hypothetical protein
LYISLNNQDNPIFSEDELFFQRLELVDKWYGVLIGLGQNQKVDENILQKNQKCLICWLSMFISDFLGWFLWFEIIRNYSMTDFFKTLNSA